VINIINKNRLNKSGKRYIVATFILLLFQALLLFISSGKIYILRFWVFIIVNLIYLIFATILLYKINPELINQRGSIKPDTKLWDQFLMRAHNIVLIFILPIVVGLDVGRFHWSYLNCYYLIPGYLLYFTSNILVNWAMIVNPHFEATVRIQKDREHKVITSGPYKLIRHPGYLGGIVWAMGVPMILGSIYGFIPSIVGIIIFIIRTGLEDKTLLNELEGYAEYSKKVKYRLIPGIW
jgi:protein-S-isoprenylcysteine O-methyltransferase Ste14